MLPTVHQPRHFKDRSVLPAEHAARVLAIFDAVVPKWPGGRVVVASTAGAKALVAKGRLQRSALKGAGGGRGPWYRGSSSVDFGDGAAPCQVVVHVLQHPCVMVRRDAAERQCRARWLGEELLRGALDLPPRLQAVRDGLVACEVADVAAAFDALGDAAWVLVRAWRADQASLSSDIRTGCSALGADSEAYCRELLHALRAKALGGWWGRATEALCTWPGFREQVQLAATGDSAALGKPVLIRGVEVYLREVVGADTAGALALPVFDRGGWWRMAAPAVGRGPLVQTTHNLSTVPVLQTRHAGHRRADVAAAGQARDAAPEARGLPQGR